MTTTDWLTALGLGLMCGAVGQVARIVAGLKKLSDQRGGMAGMQTAFVPMQLGVSPLIGATAGALAAIGLAFDPSRELPTHVITTLPGAGHAGADCIEAFMRKARPKG
jgi:hypothetical protein